MIPRAGNSSMASEIIQTDRLWSSGLASRIAVLRGQSHDGKGANAPTTRPHDAYLVRCRVPNYYETCSERVRVCQLKKYRQLENCSG